MISFFSRMCEETGYVPRTTFWEDFSIAEHFSIKDVKDTYRRAFNEWKTDHIYLTELVMVLNWKIWFWNGFNETFAQLYQELFEKADAWAIDNLKGDELDYFLQTVD